MAVLRKATTRLLDMVNDGEMDPVMALQMCLDWMSEAEVAGMMDSNDLLADEADADEDDEFDDPTYYLFHVYTAESPWAGETGEEQMVTMVAICPETYFRQTGYQWDQDIPLLLSPKLEAEMVSLIEYAGTVDEARAELLALGLREDPEYSKFIQKHIQTDQE